MVSNLNFFAWVLYLSILALIIIAGYKNWNLNKLQKELKTRIAEIEKSYEQKIKDLEHYEREMKSLTAFQEKKILFVTENKELDIKNEIDDIKNIGFKNIKTLTLNDLGQLRECDLLIYHFDNEKEDIVKENINKVVDFLLKIDGSKRIPLLIYTKNYVDDKDLNYRNYIFARMPLTLIGHFNTLIRL